MLTPHWMTAAERAAHSFRPVTAGLPHATHSVYVVFLHYPARSGRLGLYVGQTARDPDWRFDQHKAGYRSSSAVRRFGVSLLPQLFNHLNPLARWEAIEIEAALANAFDHVGVPWVEGGH